ncbi:MAG: SpoIIE family protein phosphatase, partial [Armatimonadetes bacterium]|nr:SpoIIE family protein phosphatase [Armatimonadota bacterium]
FPISLNTTLVLDDAATPIAILGIIRDITERKRVEELSIALNRINTTINSTLDFHRIMQRVVVEANNAMGSEAAWITLRDGDGWLIGHHSDPSSRLIGRRFADDEAHIACLVSRTRKSVTINDTCRYKLQNPRVIVEECGIRSLLAVPLRAKNDLVGVLIFVHHAAPVHFSDISADFAKKLGASISLALENARLYWAQRRIAETLQQSLIRPTPQVAGLEIGVAYSPAFEAEKVGGDFYDVFEVRKNVVAVLIGDVAGKGVDAAGLTETVRSSVRALAYINHAPSFVLDRANQTLLRQIPPDQFVTAAFLTIDTETGRTLYASAGHPSAVLCGKECGFLDSPSGLPLGTLNRSYSEAELHVQEMETLILYTDGLH